MHLHLASVEVLRRVSDEAAGPVALHTGDDVVRIALDALRDDTEAVVLHNWAATDTTEQTLLNTLLKLDDGYTRRGSRDLDRNFAHSEPGDSDAGRRQIGVNDSDLAAV